MKKANGTGSIRKLKGSRRKPYAVYVSVWDKDHIHRTRKLLGTFSTHKEADAFRIATLCSSDDIERRNKNKSITLYDCALEAIKRDEKHLRERTIEAYNDYLKMLQPLWSTKMKDFNGEMYQSYVDLLVSKGIKAKRISNMNIIAKKAVNVAIRKGILTSNPIQSIDIGGAIRQADRIRRPFTHSEISLLWTNKTDELAKIILMMIYTGMRVDEFLHITSEDVDFNSSTITVKQSKTNAGLRIIPIHKSIKHFVISNINKYDGLSPYVVGYTFRTHFKEYTQSLGMNHIPHETRYTFATLLDEARLKDGHRIDINVSKVLIGHKVSDITKGTYTHENYDRLEEAINCLKTSWK